MLPKLLCTPPRRPKIILFPSTALIKNFRSASAGWVPTACLGKPSKGFYRAVSAIGFAATPSSPGMVKIARDEMVEITSVNSETWNYKKLDGSGVRGLVNPTCLIKVELDTEPPAYPPPPPPPQGLGFRTDAAAACSKVGNGQGTWHLLPRIRNRWSKFGPMRGNPKPALEAKARMPLETDGTVHDAGGTMGEVRGSYFDAEVMQDWRAQVEGDGHTLGGETAMEGDEPTKGDEPVVLSPDMQHEEDAPVYLASV